MTNETRERDIYLAKAMGWRYVPPNRETGEIYSEGVHCLRNPEGQLWPSPWAKTEDETWAQMTPHFHVWESAKAKLLRWLAADEARFEAFYNEIDAVYDETDCENQFSVVSWSRFLVTLSPAQVAESAEKALRGMEAVSATERRRAA
jgi:hypothetical protein